MSFAVAWNPSATIRIDMAWEQADESHRRKIMEALADAEQKLRDAPMLVGESREDQFKRVLVSPPLTLYYHVQSRMRVVRVVEAQVYGRTA